MITNLREAKARFSELIERAADGEEIVITVRGRAKARLSGISDAQGNLRRVRIADL